MCNGDCKCYSLIKDGVPVNIGDVVTDFRGDCAVVVGWSIHHNRVHLKKIGSEHTFEYFPQVIGATFEEN